MSLCLVDWLSLHTLNSFLGWCVSLKHFIEQVVGMTNEHLCSTMGEHLCSLSPNLLKYKSSTALARFGEQHVDLLIVEPCVL